MDIGYVNDKVKMTHFFLHYALLVAITYNMVIKKDPLRARIVREVHKMYNSVSAIGSDTHIARAASETVRI